MTAENLPFRKHALLYAEVEKALKASTKPMTANDFANIPVIAELCTHPSRIYDAAESLHTRKLARKIPAEMKRGDRSRFAYEWIKFLSPANAVTKAEETGAAGFLKETAEHVKPEIIVGANSVVIITEKIKITVEY